LRWLESVGEDLQNMVWGNGDVSSRRRNKNMKKKENKFGLRDVCLPIQVPLEASVYIHP